MNTFLDKWHITEIPTDNKLSVYLPVILVWSLLFLLPFSRLAELPGFIMLVMAITLMLKKQIHPWHQPYRYFTVAFALIWVPMLLALPDAVAFEKSLKTTLLYSRFYFAGLFVVWVLRDRHRQQLFIKLAALLVIFWAMDGLLQFITGYNVLGYEPVGSRLTGIFAGVGIKLGPYLAIFSVLVLFYLVNPLRKAAGRQILLLLVFSVLIFLMVIASGSRTSWLMLGIGYAAYFLTFYFYSNARIKLLVTSLLVVALLGLWTGYKYNDSIQAPIDKTLLLLEGDWEMVNDALSKRLDIWKVSLDVIEDYPFNGIGARGFRYIYKDYASSEDYFIQNDIIPTHPHGLVPEVMTETGILGISGYVLLLTFLFYIWMKARDRRQQVFPLAVIVLVITFPLNMHWALYSSAWGQVFCYLIALYMAYIAIPVSDNKVMNRAER